MSCSVSRALNNLCRLYTAHINTCHILLLLLTVHCTLYTTVSATQIAAHNLVAILLTIHVGSAIASFKDLVTVAQESSTNQTADV